VTEGDTETREPGAVVQHLGTIGNEAVDAHVLDPCDVEQVPGNRVEGRAAANTCGQG
jgi:hypothetical protein